MSVKLRWDDAPCHAIRQSAEGYAGALASALVVALQAGFSAQSPAPAGAPPARKSGRLAGSIIAVREGRYVWRVTVGATYAVYLEYGTRHMMARPFFLRAMGQVRASLS